MSNSIGGHQLSNTPQNTGQSLSALQKSISAISGAFITSLLVTPLDVVRVRLQSQQPQPPPTSNVSGFIPRLGNSAFASEGSSGVTACCREVFFSQGFSVNRNNLHCNYIPFDSPALESG